MGFFTETTSFLRNPGVRRSPSYVYVYENSYMEGGIKKIKKSLFKEFLSSGNLKPEKTLFERFQNNKSTDFLFTIFVVCSL